MYVPTKQTQHFCSVHIHAQHSSASDVQCTICRRVWSFRGKAGACAYPSLGLSTTKPL